jgi:hypothetical protein
MQWPEEKTTKHYTENKGLSKQKQFRKQRG